MSIFNLFKKKRELTIEEQQWNKMWDLWVEEKARSPYAELMTYETEINNGGHGQFFDNISSTGDLPKTISKLNTVLSDVLKDNLNKAYEAYSRAGEDDETLEEIFDECDDVFYENESEIERLLKEYAKKIVIKNTSYTQEELDIIRLGYLWGYGRLILGFIFPAIFSVVTQIFNNIEYYWLYISWGSYILFVGIYDIIGALLEFKHVLVSLQLAYHQKPDPRSTWTKSEKREYIFVGIFFVVCGFLLYMLVDMPL